MARVSSINVKLPERELRWVRAGVNSGKYGSATEVVRAGLRKLFRDNARKPKRQPRSIESTLAEGYRATARRDRKLAAEWSKLVDTWPEK